ncbi:MAG: hypothetical protein VB059_13300 [Raineyella sp.]|nr:hypothetical protein [Raineyella sp.]
MVVRAVRAAPPPLRPKPGDPTYLVAGHQTETYERVRVPLKSWGIHSIDVLNTLPALMAADGLLFDAEIIGAWICEHGGVRLVLRAVDRPRDAPFGFTVTRADTATGDGDDLAAGLWAGLARARELVTRGLNGDGDPGEDGIRWLTGPVDDAPWTDPIPTLDTPVDRAPAARFNNDPDPVPPKHHDDLAHPAWPGMANVADLRYRWRGTLWSTTQLTWYVTADPPRTGFRSGPLLAAWALTPGTFRVIFHDPRNGLSEEDHRMIREMLPEGQPWPRWGNIQYAGGYWENNWDPSYMSELNLMLYESTETTPPLAYSNPEQYIWQDTIIWERRDSLPPPHIPTKWVNVYAQEIDHHAN